MRRLLTLMISALCAVACVYPFEADVNAAPGNLVIEGDIFVGGISYFSISRVVALSDESQIIPVEGVVYVEASDGTKYESSTVLSDLGYAVPLTYADPNLEYRLVAKVNGKEYVTPFTAPAGECVIDDVNWSIDYDIEKLKLQMSLHSNDGSRHFRYRYSEVWEYHATAQATCYYVTPDPDHKHGQIIDYPYGENIYYCWKYQNSRGINLATTEQMSEDRLVDYPFKYIDNRDNRLSTLYRITLDVYPVSEDSYKFYENLKDVSSATGDLFSPIPNAMRGNIRCSSVDDEMVYGYIAVVRPQTRTLYIESKDEVYYFYQHQWFDPDFEEESVTEDNWNGYYRMGYLPYRNHPFMGSFWAKANCLDCRRAGGTKLRPEDWPNDHF